MSVGPYHTKNGRGTVVSIVNTVRLFRQSATYNDMSAPAVVRPLERVVHGQSVPCPYVSRRFGREFEDGTVIMSGEREFVIHGGYRRGEDGHGRLDGEPWLSAVCRLNDDAERRTSSTAEGEEEFLVLTLVRCAVDAIWRDNLDLDLL